MRCQQCNETEATVHLKEVTDGKLRELHLCESCARDKGYHLVIEQNKLTIAAQFIWMAENLYPETSSKVGAVQCPSCGLRYSQFSRVGRVGCPECYDAFHPQLQKILLRVHGATKHKGRVPADATVDRGSGTSLTAAPPQTSTEIEPPAESEANAGGRRAIDAGATAETVRGLEEKLRHAVETEAYEEAARLRDEIRKLQGGKT